MDGLAWSPRAPPSHTRMRLLSVLFLGASISAAGPDLGSRNSGPASVEVGFCRSDGSGFLLTQPADQLERWGLPYDNGTHLVIDWTNDKVVSGRNVTEYYVDVTTSAPVLNLFVGTFGGFPQDVCAPGGSKAKDAVAVEGSASSCSEYTPYGHRQQRQTAFEIPSALRRLAKWDVTVVVRGYGSHAPNGRPHERTKCVWWCHAYRKPRMVVSATRTPTLQPTTANHSASRRVLATAFGRSRAFGARALMPLRRLLDSLILRQHSLS